MGVPGALRVSCSLNWGWDVLGLGLPRPRAQWEVAPFTWEQGSTTGMRGEDRREALCRGGEPLCPVCPQAKEEADGGEPGGKRGPTGSWEER